MEVRVTVIDIDTRKVLLEGTSSTSAKKYIAQRGGRVKSVKDWDAVPYEKIPGVGARVANLRKIWVLFSRKSQ